MADYDHATQFFHHAVLQKLERIASGHIALPSKGTRKDAPYFVRLNPLNSQEQTIPVDRFLLAAKDAMDFLTDEQGPKSHSPYYNYHKFGEELSRQAYDLIVNGPIRLV